MSVLEKLKNMPIGEFYRVCNRLVKEMGFLVRTGVYRDNEVVIDAIMPVPGGDIRYIIIFVRKDILYSSDVEDLIDFETMQIRWMLVTTGTVDPDAKSRIPHNMDVTIMDGGDLERLVLEFGILEEESDKGSYLPSAGKLDEELDWAEEFLKNKNYEKAMEHLDKALKIKITSRGLKLKAKILGEMGKYDEAIEILKKVLVEDVRDDEAWFILAKILENMGRDEEAEEAYAQCVRFNPRNLNCWLNRGNVLFSQEKLDEALLCYDNALKINQNLPDAWNNRGIVLKHKGKYDEAMRSYNAALKYDPDFAKSYLNKAILFYEMRRYEEAENEAYEYLKREKSDDGYVLLANIYLKRQMMNKAEEMARKALEINPGNVEAREILRKLHGEEESAASEEVKRGIAEILSKIPKDLEIPRKLLKEAKELSEEGNLKEAREKLWEAREWINRYVDEQASKMALIEDIMEISTEIGEKPPDNLENMSLEELRNLRSEMIIRIRRNGMEDRTKEKLLKSLDIIREDMIKAGIISDDLDSHIEETRALINDGKFSEAIENLIKVSAKVERKHLDELKEYLIKDTIELLSDAGMKPPDNLEDMDMTTIRELRKEAITKIKEKGVKNNKEAGGDVGDLRGMVAALTGGAMSSAMSNKAQGKIDLKEELISDIKELSEISERGIPEELGALSIEELRNIRKSIIEEIKSGAKTNNEQKMDYPRGFGQILLELGKTEELFNKDINEDEFLANARGITYFERGEYDKALEQFKRAVILNPDFEEAEFNLGYTLLKMGRNDEAMVHLKKVHMENMLKKKNLNP